MIYIYTSLESVKHSFDMIESIEGLLYVHTDAVIYNVPCTFGKVVPTYSESERTGNLLAGMGEVVKTGKLKLADVYVATFSNLYNQPVVYFWEN